MASLNQYVTTGDGSGEFLMVYWSRGSRQSTLNFAIERMDMCTYIQYYVLRSQQNQTSAGPLEIAFALFQLQQSINPKQSLDKTATRDYYYHFSVQSVMKPGRYNKSFPANDENWFCDVVRKSLSLALKDDNGEN